MYRRAVRIRSSPLTVPRMATIPDGLAEGRAATRDSWPPAGEGWAASSAAPMAPRVKRNRDIVERTIAMPTVSQTTPVSCARTASSRDVGHNARVVWRRCPNGSVSGRSPRATRVLWAIADRMHHPSTARRRRSSLPLARSSAHERLVAVARRGTVAMVRAAGSSELRSERQATGIETVAPGRARTA